MAWHDARILRAVRQRSPQRAPLPVGQVPGPCAMNPLATLAGALAIFVAGGMGGIKWQLGVQARAQLAAADARATDAKAQIKNIDKASATQVATVATLNKQLGAAREKIGALSNRECLAAGTVGMLNALGAEPGAAAASQPAGAPPAAAPGGDERYATQADTARAIAICRATYAAVSGQLNQILDIEAQRHPADER